MSPIYGRRLLPCVLDDICKHTPSRVFATICENNVGLSLLDVTFGQIGNAVSYMAWWLLRKLPPKKPFETLAYVGISDLRYTILFLAAVKCRYTIFFVSPQHTRETNQTLLDQTNCQKLCFASELSEMASSFLNANDGMEKQQIPTLQEMLYTTAESFAFQLSFEEAASEPILILHSSGSTGIPKTVTLTNETFSTLDRDHYLPSETNRRKHDFTLWEFPERANFYCAFPPVHLAGFVAMTVIPLFTETATPLFGPATRPADAFIAQTVLREYPGRLRALFVPPSILQQLLDLEESTEIFKTLDFVCFAGGPLPSAVGNLLCKVTSLCQYYGATETFQVQQLMPAPETWDYFEWHPALDLYMDQHDVEENIFELVLRPSENSAVKYTCPGIKEYRTSDLFQRHSLNPKLWRFWGRVDDIIVMSNGKKFNPLQFEAVIAASPYVNGALVLGQARPLPVLMIEPATDQQDTPVETLYSQLEPSIAKANLEVPTYAHVNRLTIIVSSPGKPFIRTAKGTIRKRMTEDLYKDEINQLYHLLENSSNGYHKAWGRPISKTNVRNQVNMLLEEVLHVKNIPPATDLFTIGLNSNGIILFTRLLNEAFRKLSLSGSKIDFRFIYDHPTLDGIIEQIWQIALTERAGRHVSAELETDSTVPLDIIIQGYAKSLREHLGPSKQPKGKHVLLVGSTGSLAKYILESLLGNASIEKVTCIDRSSEAYQRAKIRTKSKLLDSKVEFLRCELTKSNLGLPLSLYQRLQQGIDTILYVAWRVDFNLRLSSFEPQIIGLQNVIKFSLGTYQLSQLVYISSTAAAMRSLEDNQPIYESDFMSGYGTSKYVAEQVLESASEEYNIPVLVLRLGQIAGPLNMDGIWPTQEWLPSILRTSRSLGLMPSLNMKVDWIPADLMAEAILEIIFSHRAPKFEIYHLVNPHTVSWMEFLDTASQELSSDMTIVPLTTWLKILELMSATEENWKRFPALKILDFIKQWEQSVPYVVWDTQNSVRASRTIAEMGPVTADWIKQWIRQLARADFFK